MSTRKTTADVWAISQRLHAKVRRFFDPPLGPEAKPLEIREALLDEIERRVVSGARTFPYTRVMVRVLAKPGSRAATEAAFRDFDARVRARLTEVRCTPPPGLSVDVTLVRKAPAGWDAGQHFAVEYQARPSGSPAPVRAVLQLTVLAGHASQPVYTIDHQTVLVGRGAEPVDCAGGVRRNHVVFDETGDDVSETVGRAHARFTWDASAREYRVYDEGSSNGTQVVRGGVTVTVAPRDPRGVRVRTGDEVQFGRARVRIRVRTAP